MSLDGSAGHLREATPGFLIRAWREAAGLSQEDLAARASVTTSVVQGIERRDAPELAAAAVIKIATALSRATRREGPAGPSSGDARSSPPYRDRGTTSAPTLRIDVLGPLEACRGDVIMSLGRPMQRAVLGLLSITPNVPVHRDQIIEALWGELLRANAIRDVQTHISRLRSVLCAGQPDSLQDPLIISREGNSYQLNATGDQLDLFVHDQLVARARGAAVTGQIVLACQAYALALDLWRGEPLADIEVLRDHLAVRALSALRGVLVAEYASLALRAGQAGEVLPYLIAGASVDPYNERVHALLMLALAETGQQAMALEVFADIRRRLDVQLGARPGRELADAHRHVLGHQVAACQ
jgi:DNA-binding SARP family transcriptional activator